jgi:ketosteroid isomerase-like protein
MMDAKQVLKLAVDAWNRHDVEGFVALASPDVQIVASGGVDLRGLEGMRQYYWLWRTACPDNALTYHNIVGDGDRAMGEATFTGTHDGPLHHPAGNVPATGRRLNGDFVAAYRTAGGKVTSLRVYLDTLELMTQLGLVAEPAKS